MSLKKKKKKKTAHPRIKQKKPLLYIKCRNTSLKLLCEEHKSNEFIVLTIKLKYKTFKTGVINFHKFKNINSLST